MKKITNKDVYTSAVERLEFTFKEFDLELEMQPDEVLRLKQITGLAEMFSDEEFSKSWE